ncbi:MAG: NACHT domain-containing protein [bacterium]
MTDQKNFQKLYIFLASPADVAKERAYVHTAVVELNKTGSGAAHAQGIQFEVLGYDTHVSPDMGRAQAVTFDQLTPDNWDIFIGILWQRFGTPSGAVDSQTGEEFRSGTIEEFTRAYELWQQHGSPRILFYRSKQSVNYFELRPDQKQALEKVEAFFTQFGPKANHPGYYRTYQTPEDFEKAVRQDLMQFLLNYQKSDRQPTQPPVDRTPAPPESVEVLQRRYLKNLQNYCNLLPLAAIAEESDPHANARLTLNQVYIGLNTTDLLDKTGKPMAGETLELARRLSRAEQEEVRPLTALEAAGRHEALVILGDPGSGKTSFLNHLMFTLAEKLQRPESILPDDWPHGPLLPVRVLLRELAISLEKKGAANSLSLNAEARRREFSRIVHEHLAEHLIDYEAADFARDMRTAISRGHCLIVFDGLDEAPFTQRPLVRMAVEDFCAANAGNRFLVTCRVRSYEGPACLQACKTVLLAPLDDQQMPAFIEHWYDSLVQIEQFKPEQAAVKKDDLKEAVQRLPADMVRNPLLLTTLANVHTHNVELPRQRVKLYKSASALLLRRWQEHKAGKISLFDRIGLQSNKEIDRALRELGYSAQKAQQGQEAADIPQAEAVTILTRHFSSLPKPLVAAGEFLDFVDQSAGLLIGRGGASGSVYAFPHRTFQEYFAGCHLAKGVRDFKRELLKLLPEGDYWRLTAQLGVEELLYNDGNDGPVIDAAYTLCPLQTPPRADEKAWRCVVVRLFRVGSRRNPHRAR